MVVAAVHAAPEAKAEAEAEAEAGGYHQTGRLLVQPIPETKPICHVEYEVRGFEPYLG